MSGDNSMVKDSSIVKVEQTQKRSGAVSRSQTAASHSRHERFSRQERLERSPQSVTAIAQLLRSAAARIEDDPQLAQSLLNDAQITGAPSQPASATSRRSATPRSRAAAQPSKSLSSTMGTVENDRLLDPFAILREQGQTGLLTCLRMLDLEALRTLVRSHRLDPGRIASRWTDRERLVELIAEQVQARAGLGRAFERV